MADRVQSSTSKRPRGRPRDLAARDAILGAARALLEEGGPGRVTIEAVAARAGVSRPTVYRWWPDRHAVAMAALIDEPEIPPRSTLSSDRSPERRGHLDALASQLHRIVERFASPIGRHIGSMLAAADPESELSRAFRSHFVLARRAEGALLVERAIAAGELGADTDPEVLLDQLYGAVFFRLLMGHAKLDAAFVDRLVQSVRANAPGARRIRGRARRP